MAPFLIPLKVVIPLGLVLVILITILWVLYSRNKELFKKIASEKNRFYSYLESAKELRESSLEKPQEKFNSLNRLVRGFFKDYLELPYNQTYLELEKNFMEKNKREYADFCKLMSDANYSGKNLEKDELAELINMFIKILRDY